MSCFALRIREWCEAMRAIGGNTCGVRTGLDLGLGAAGRAFEQILGGGKVFWMESH
jgi:hypothetical protein